MKQHSQKMKEMLSPPRDNLHGDEDSDFQPKQTPPKGFNQDLMMQQNNDSSKNSTNTSYYSDQNIPEVSKQNNYSANGLNNGQAEQEQEIELQHGHYKDKKKQTCQTFDEAADSDLNTTNTHQMTPQRSVQHSLQIQRQQQQSYLQQNGGMVNVIGSLYESQLIPQSSIMTNTLPIIGNVTNNNATQILQGLVIPNTEQTVGQYLTNHMNTMLQAPRTATTGVTNQKQNGNKAEDNDEDKDDEQKHDLFHGTGNNGNGNGIGNGNGHGDDGSGNNGNGNGDDQGNYDGGNDRQNGNNVNNNPNLQQAIQMLAQSQQMIAALLNKKDKDSFTKLPKCDIKYHGDKKDGTRDDLIRIAWEVRQWCKNKGVKYDKMFNVWMSDVLKEPAKSVIYAQAAQIKDFESLIQTLHTRYPVQSKIFQRMSDLRKFKYKRKTSMTAHVNIYKVLCNQINQEAWIWEKIHQSGRVPELPSLEQQYNILFRSINNVEKLYFEVRKLMIQSNPLINNSGYRIQSKDILMLTSNMITAEKLLYPNNEMIRYDVTTKQPIFGNRHGNNDRNRRRSGRGKGNNRGQQNKGRLNYQQTEFTGKCFACGGSHRVRLCKNKDKKKKYCQDNKLCHFCCQPGHKLADCSSRKTWQKKKEAGNDNGNKSKPKPKPKWNRSAIRFNQNCQYKSNCKFKERCHYLHPGDQRVTEVEPEDEHNEESEPDQRIERLNFINNKQRMHVKTSLEIVRMDKYSLSLDEIPEDEKVTLHLRKDQETMIKYPALWDTGSTISAVTPRLAKRMMKELRILPAKKSTFMVENGSGTDVMFDGKYLLLPTLIPNTNTFVDIKYFIMPHNQCAFGIILGFHDGKELGYKNGLQISEDEILFRHRGKNRRKKLKFVEKASSIMDRMNNHPGVALQSSNIQLYQRLDKTKEEDSYDESVDCYSDSDMQSEEESDDDDSEDGSRSH